MVVEEKKEMHDRCQIFKESQFYIAWWEGKGKKKGGKKNMQEGENMKERN